MGFWKLVTFPALFLFIVFSSVETGFAQDEPEELANAIMERFIQGEKPSAVISENTSELIKRILGISLDNNLNSLDGQFSTVGVPFEYEILEQEELSSRVVFLKYALYFEENLFLFSFYYYKGQDQWALNTWLADSNIISAKDGN